MRGVALVGGQMLVQPTIYGVFVASHVRFLREEAGPAAVALLERRLGRSVDFRATEQVPTELEARLLEECVRILAQRPMDGAEVAEEAGRLHYRNFSGTRWARLLFSVFPRDFGWVVRHAPGIAHRIFSSVRFEVLDERPGACRLAMENGGYPLAHFRGLFLEWMADFGHRGTVAAQQVSEGRQEFVLQWR